MKYLGYDIIIDPNLVTTIVLRKQTRKFKNTRWVKKYTKRTPNPTVYIANNNKMIMHPTIFEILKNQLKLKTQIKTPSVNTSFNSHNLMSNLDITKIYNNIFNTCA
jgi:hypothetical protein